MKKLVIMLLSCLTMTGCATAYVGTDTAMQDHKIKADFTHIEGNLYYCNDTKIVYWIGGSYSVNVVGTDYTTSYMTAYFAPNGLPYRYVDGKGICEIEVQE